MRLQLIKVSAATCVLMACLDAISTWLFLHNQTGVEGNPAVAHAMTIMGVIPVLLLGTLLRAGMMWGFVKIAPVWTNLVLVLTLSVLIWWTWVVYHNFFDGMIL